MLPKRIIALGASSVFGRVDPVGGGFIGRLKTWHEKKSPMYNAVYNLGIESETIRDIIERLDKEVPQRKPDAILFSLGSNDSRRVGSKQASPTTSLAAFTQQVITLIKKAQKYTKNIIVVGAYPINDVLTQPLIKTDFYYSLSDLLPYIKETKSICKNMHIPYLDMYRILTRTKNYQKFLYKDGLHCNELGHEKIFKELRKMLIKLYA